MSEPKANDATRRVLLDIVIPVYHEGEGIVPVLEALRAQVQTPFRVLLCYDRDDDSTLPPARRLAAAGLALEFVKNLGRGAHGAVVTGFRASTAPAVLVFPGDDTWNAPMLDRMVAAAQAGNDLVMACRFMPGGSMTGCPWLKAVLVRGAAWTMHRLAGVPTRDPTNGFRLFSRRVLDHIEIESTAGFTYSIELLVKVHRLGWPVAEVPVNWRERARGQSRFRVLRWLPAYLRWYAYAFATTYLHRGPATVKFRG